MRLEQECEVQNTVRLNRLQISRAKIYASLSTNGERDVLRKFKQSGTALVNILAMFFDLWGEGSIF